MYRAGLVADDARVTGKDLQRWVDQAYARVLIGSTVAWVTAGSPQGKSMALKRLESKKDLVAAAGWATLGSLVAITEDTDLDLPELNLLMQRPARTIH